MTPVQKWEVRAAEYRRRATAAHAEAQTSQLAHVREKHEVAAARWTALAVLDERPVLDRRLPPGPDLPADLAIG